MSKIYCLKRRVESERPEGAGAIALLGNRKASREGFLQRPGFTCLNIRNRKAWVSGIGLEQGTGPAGANPCLLPSTPPHLSSVINKGNSKTLVKKMELDNYLHGTVTLDQGTIKGPSALMV